MHNSQAKKSKSLQYFLCNPLFVVQKGCTMQQLAREMWLNRCSVMDVYDKTKGCSRELTEFELKKKKDEQKSTHCAAF